MSHLSALESSASKVWKAAPITEYCRNHATIDAGPTTRHGAVTPFSNVSLIACPSWPLPDTCELFMKSAIFSSGMPTQRPNTPKIPIPVER